jgi:uncharacterized protein (TIGR01777 family)
VIRLARDLITNGSESIRWDPMAGQIDTAALEGLDAVIHLAGENIAGGRWTAERKRRIYDSRVLGTNLLAKSLEGLSKPPGVLISTSAIGYYGNRGTESLREDAAPGEGFLASVCKAWESAAKPAAEKGIRLVILRIGIVLSPKGGALSKMLLPFKLGLGGTIGSGQQHMSWITLADLVGVFMFCLQNPNLRGPVNAVAPNPETNADFTKALGRVLMRPTIFPLPAYAVRLMLGDMADELLLSSARVQPAQLRLAGFKFQHPRLEEALMEILKK